MSHSFQEHIEEAGRAFHRPPPGGIADGRLPAPLLRAATDADTSQILGLIASSYDGGTTPARREHWRWKHEENPFGPSPCLVAESEGQLIGVRVFLRWNWCSGSRTIRAVRAVDTATRPAWQGKGIFSRLTMRLVEQMQAEGVSFVYNTPNSKSMPGYRKMGWSSVTKLPLWIKPLRVAGLVHRTIGGAQALLPTVEGFGTVADVLQDPRLPAFLRDISISDERYHTARTLSYLRWRYDEIPGVSYSARLEVNGQAGALVILRRRARGRLREVTISELLVTPSVRGIEAGRRLLVDLAQGTDADYVAACAAKGTLERQVLLRVGFLPIPRLGPHFTVRRLGFTSLDPTQWEHWRCSIGDLEVF